MLLTEILQNVYFSTVGSTDLKPLDINDAVVKEKLSFLLLFELKKHEHPPVLYYSTFFRQSEQTTIFGSQEIAWGTEKGSKKYKLSWKDPHCLEFHEIVVDPITKLNDIYSQKPIFHRIKSEASFEEISLFDATRKVKSYSDQKVEYYSDSDRINDLLDHFEIDGADMYAKFVAGKTVNPQRFPKPIPKPPKKSKAPESEEQRNAHIEDFERFQRDLGKWCKGGFPRRYLQYNVVVDDPYTNGNPNPTCRTRDVLTSVNTLDQDLPSPIFYRPLGPMAYDVQPIRKSRRTMRLQRLFFNPDMCGLREALVPTICVLEGSHLYPVMTGLPNMDQVPLWNLKKIMKETTDTVVICGCIQDAEALNRANAKIDNVVFTGFVGDNLDRVDFSPLNGKNVVFLISNHNGMSMADAYFEADKVYQYLTKPKKGKKKLTIPEFAFVQRQVKYPDSSEIGTPKDLASAYYYNRPIINPQASFPKIPLMDESNFASMLAKIRKSPTDSSLFLKKEKKTCKRKTIYPSDDTIIRSLLYRGETTLLSGHSGSGKSRFCQTLIRYIVNGNDTKFLGERFWTRCCKNSTIKIVYWNFDGIGEPKLKEWEQQCLKGLPTKKRNDIIIENSPRFKEKGFHKKNKEPLLEPYKNRIENYALTRGTPDHPVDLLIVDTLSRVWNKDKVTDSLDFLADLAHSTNMAILVIHHTDDTGKIRGGISVEDVPRVSLILRNIQQKSASFDDCDPEIEEPEFYEMWYHKNNRVGLNIEKKPFYCVRENIDKFTVQRPACSREEMFDVLHRYYKLKEKLSNKAIGELLGCSDTVVRTKNLIDKETYEAILEKIRVNSPLTPQEEKERQKEEEKERQKQKWNNSKKWNKIESGDGS